MVKAPPSPQSFLRSFPACMYFRQDDSHRKFEYNWLS
ncbi:hypothetical protein FOCG_16330 [Fusarium oxysporum f. sp. radicis-lycopersici 26381]|uniref:Uncharacterized protein n=2 Tax=Fusarium oxysporum TaxID=5507 RepID=W9IY48_FUSOX|nr:hypothetical protein FOYG_02261 [Fusarium oxysporum NRRL 32931]EXA30787.1 hypothetical protein FOVG_17883 [Fusarium oxysporum f. sp. pisi HDV247]EXL41526.1 hypothetical protein FOCG_16330 [Fusarium oxysporum f. sp. radicis-lycopersici 26381]